MASLWATVAAVLLVVAALGTQTVVAQVHNTITYVLVVLTRALFADVDVVNMTFEHRMRSKTHRQDKSLSKALHRMRPRCMLIQQLSVPPW